MKIVYDGHSFRWQKFGGVRRYFYEIVSRLPADWQPTILGVERSTGNLPHHQQLKVSTRSSIRPRRFTQPLKTQYWRMLVRSADIVHPTYYPLASGIQYTQFKRPIVVTVHDFIGATYPHLEDDSEATIRDQNAAILAASHIICVSSFTEQDLLSRYPHLSGRTSVIHHGSSFPVSQAKQPDEIFETPTFLFVGNRDTYKNFQFVLTAFAAAAQCNPRMRLCVVGKPLTMDEKWQIHFLGLTDRIDCTAHADDTKLAELYRNSVGLLYPSRHEGFGIPPLEAMACGTVVIAAQATSVPEVVGDAGILLDPTQRDLWTDCMLAVATGKVPREQLIAAGRKRAQTLSWDASAAKHLDVYRGLA